MATSSSEEGPAAAAGAGAISTAAAAPEVANGDGCDDVSNGEATPEQRSPSETGSKSLMERVQARVRNDPATDYREDIVRSIFGEVGTPVEGGRERGRLGLPADQTIKRSESKPLLLYVPVGNAHAPSRRHRQRPGWLSTRCPRCARFLSCKGVCGQTARLHSGLWSLLLLWRQPTTERAKSAIPLHLFVSIPASTFHTPTLSRFDLHP